MKTQEAPNAALFNDLLVVYPNMETQLIKHIAKAVSSQHPDDIREAVAEWVRLEPYAPKPSMFAERVRGIRDVRLRAKHPELDADPFGPSFAFSTGGRKMPNWARAAMNKLGNKLPYLSDDEDPGPDGTDAAALTDYQARGVVQTRTCSHPQDLDDGIEKVKEHWHNVRHPRSGWSCAAKCQRYERECPGLLYDPTLDAYTRCGACR